MHRVVADFLRAQTERHFEDLTAITQAVVNAMPKVHISTPAMWPSMDACEPHALALLQIVMVQEPRSVFVQHTAALGNALVALAMEQGKGQRAIGLAIKILPALAIEHDGRRVISAGDPNIGAFTQVLAPALALGGQHESAIEMQRIYLSYLEQSGQTGEQERGTRSEIGAPISPRATSPHAVFRLAAPDCCSASRPEDRPRLRVAIVTLF